MSNAADKPLLEALLDSWDHPSPSADKSVARLAPFRPLHKPGPVELQFDYCPMLPRMSIHVKGTTGLVVAAVIMMAVLIAFPAYRVFLAISLGIGIVVALVLQLRNKYRPIDDKEVDNKRPLGLD
jgi:hypothetical protein